MLSTKMTIDQTAQAVRAIERGQRYMRIYYTERAPRHYRTSRERVGVERDFCIAMVFGPQPMLGCIEQACGRLDYRRIYVLSSNSAFQSAALFAPTLPQFSPRHASLTLRVSLSRAWMLHQEPVLSQTFLLVCGGCNGVRDNACCLSLVLCRGRRPDR